MADAAADLQKALMEFLKRRHPLYERMLPHWNFLESTYAGGRDWFCEENIFRYVKEGDNEYDARIERAYRFNHTREVTDLVQKYIFKAPAVRNDADAIPEIKAFWENATLGGLDINQFMRFGSTSSSIFGRPWVFTDSTKTAAVVSKADEKKAGARVYAYMVKPQNILDVGFSKDGVCTWVLVREHKRDDEDPIFASGDVIEQYRLWDQTEWKLFEIQESGNGKRKKSEVVLVGADVHGLGQVPGFPLDHVIGDNRYSAPGLIDDIAYLDRANANYLSCLDAIIQDQTFSTLAMPGQALLPGEEMHDKLLEMGTKRAFIYDGADGARPEYLSPDPKQAGMIITVINKIIGEIYHTLGMSGERTKSDNNVGIDNSSGVAKAYDFERINSLLAAKADSLENAENKLVELVSLWHGKKPPKAELVKYPDTFDVRSLFDEFTVAERLQAVEAPKTVRQEQMNQVIDKLFPRLSADLKAKMKEDLKTWPVDPVERAGELAKATAPPTSFTASKRNPQTSNRQGQVTGDT